MWTDSQQNGPTTSHISKIKALQRQLFITAKKNYILIWTDTLNPDSTEWETSAILQDLQETVQCLQHDLIDFPGTSLPASIMGKKSMGDTQEPIE
jgi:hypothetical protein